MTPKGRSLFAAGMAVLALGALGGVLVSMHGSSKPTVDLRIVGATAPRLAPPTTTPSTIALTTTPQTAAPQTTTVTVQPVTTVAPKVSQARLRAPLATTMTRPAPTPPTVKPKVTLIPPIQCTPQFGCGPMKP